MKPDKPEDKTTNLESSRDFQLRGYALNDRSDTNTVANTNIHAEVKDAQFFQKHLYHEQEKAELTHAEMPYDLEQIADLSTHFAHGFDLLKKAVEHLAK